MSGAIPSSQLANLKGTFVGVALAAAAIKWRKKSKYSSASPVSKSGENTEDTGTDIVHVASATSVMLSPQKESCEESNPAWPFRSSETNYEIAKKEYSDSPVEEYVATALGDELPVMRDALIEMKHEGEGFIQRHIHAWLKLSDWKVDLDNDLKEELDPIKCKGKT